MELAFSDVREYKLLDSVYTKDDVRTMVDEMNEEVKTTVEKELENNTYVAAAMLKMLLSQAEEAGCAQLSIDTNKLEDMKLLQDVKAIEKASVDSRAPHSPRSIPEPSIHTPHVFAQLKARPRETRAFHWSWTIKQTS